MYHHHTKTGPNTHLHDPRSFREAIEDELQEVGKDDFYSNPVSYVKRGVYIEQLLRYYDLFPPEQILILESGEMAQKWDASLKKITSFLELPFQAIPTMKAHKSRVDNKSGYPGRIKIASRVLSAS